MLLTCSESTLTGGFKKPRELTWLTGIVLAVLTVSFGVTGYWAIRIVTGVPDALPIVGPLLEFIALALVTPATDVLPVGPALLPSRTSSSRTALDGWDLYQS